MHRLEKGRIAEAAHVVIEGTDRHLASRTENKLTSLCKRIETAAAAANETTTSSTSLSTHERVRNDVSTNEITLEEITLSADLVGTVEWIVTWMFLLPDHEETTWYYKDRLEWNDASLAGVNVRPVTFRCTPGSVVASVMFSLAHVNTRDAQLILRTFCQQKIINGAASYNFPGFRNMKLVFDKINEEMGREDGTLAKPLRVVLKGIGCVASGGGGQGRVALPMAVFRELEEKLEREKELRLNAVAAAASKEAGGARRGSRNVGKKKKK